jgi:hypothetical protein
MTCWYPLFTAYKVTSNGQLIHQTLVAHYEGEFQSRAIQNAHATIVALEYQNQAFFLWESFSNRIAKA